MPPLSIRYYGIFDLNKIIKVIEDWISKYDFDVDSKKTTKDESTPQGFEYKLQCSRSVTAYAKYIVKINLATRNMFDVTLKKDNISKEMKKGSLDIDVEKDVSIDYEKYFEKGIAKLFGSSLKKFFGKIFMGEKKVIEDRLDEIIAELLDNLKKALNEDPLS